MILAPQGFASGINPQRRRQGFAYGRGGLGRRQTIGHDLLNGLVEWWPLNEQSGNRRGVHARLNLTDNATVTGADGVGSLASQFTAANSEYLSRASEAALQAGDIDFTLCCWAKFDSLGASRGLVTKDTTAAGGREYDLQFNGTSLRLRFLVSSDGSAAVTVDDTNLGALSTSVWYFVTGWHDSVNNVIGIATNGGTAVTAAHTTGVFTGSTEFDIGRFAGGAFAYHDGGMQRVGIWKRVLTADERTWLYNSGRGRDYPFV